VKLTQQVLVAGGVLLDEDQLHALPGQAHAPDSGVVQQPVEGEDRGPFLAAFVAARAGERIQERDLRPAARLQHDRPPRIEIPLVQVVLRRRRQLQLPQNIHSAPSINRMSQQWSAA
jgi:hypothetical protein